MVVYFSSGTDVSRMDSLLSSWKVSDCRGCLSWVSVFVEPLWFVSWVLTAFDLLYMRFEICAAQPDFVWCILSPRPFLNIFAQTTHGSKSLESVCMCWVRNRFGPSCWILLPPPLSPGFWGILFLMDLSSGDLNRTRGAANPCSPLG